jgi:hypothetical protein
MPATTTVDIDMSAESTVRRASGFNLLVGHLAARWLGG